VAPHSVEDLFQCPARPTQLTTQDLWDGPDAVADILKLDEAMGYNNNDDDDYYCYMFN